jgi:hypothetical protein
VYWKKINEADQVNCADTSYISWGKYFSTLELKKSGNSLKMDLTGYNINMFTANQSLQISARAGI